ncbi:MAG TPA: hypothetical protein VHG09_02010 [Longimicrobiales bacterium]|nr:hypothetical protein [Longimicrobiales bacterium]
MKPFGATGRVRAAASAAAAGSSIDHLARDFAVIGTFAAYMTINVPLTAATPRQMESSPRMAR